MLKQGFFTFHIVSESPWPLYMSAAAFVNMLTLLEWLLGETSFKMLSLSIMFSVFTFYGWVRDISCEGLLEGSHTFQVQKGLKMGMVLFILSEVLFFFSFFWGLFYSSITPSVELGSWPPSGLMPIDPLSVPLLGTMVLISSGASVTWSHHGLMKSDLSQSKKGLIWTIVLGVMFTILQASEYYETSFSINDSVYGSIFFMSTGFHGLHVIIGTIFLMVCLIRLVEMNFSKTHFVGFEAAAWYWHFVDLVWLLLYICAYWWGS